jgi:ketosteroid isomerase-like protein
MTDPHPFRAAWETRDLNRWSDSLAPDVVAVSPMLSKPFRGRESVVELYAVLFENLDDLEITDELTEGDSSAFFWRATAGGRQIQGSDLIRLNAEGKVTELTVMIRPLVAIGAFASAMGPPLARKRGAARAALARAVGLPLMWMMALVDRVASALVLRRS